MKNWRGAVSQEWGLVQTTTLIGRRAVANGSMDTESPKPRAIPGLARASDSHDVCDQHDWTRLDTTGHGLVLTFFWGGKSRQGGRSNTAIRLIPMGDWCDLVRNQTSEKTGITHAAR